MAKAWAEVAGSEQFKALSQPEQETARQQYFDAVVAPKVPAADLDLARQQFLSSTALPAAQPAPAARPAPAPAPTASSAFDSAPGTIYSDPMGGGDFSAIVEAKKPKLVAERAIAALPPEPKGQVVAPGIDRMLDPKFVAAVEAQLNSMPEAQRTAKLQELLQRPDAYGRAAKVVAERYAQLNKVTLPRAREISDLRLEPQIERFIQQGAPRDLAEHLATMQAKSGRLQKGVSRLEPNVLGTKTAEAAEIRAEELKDAGFFERVGAGMASEATKTGLGLINVFADITGDTNMQERVAGATKIEEARQGAIPKGKSIFERSAQGAMTSLGTQAPMAVMSMLTGTSVPLLIQAGVQQFGSSYGEARSAGISPTNAATRAIPMAAAEVFFERFGMEKAMAGLRAFVAKNGYAEVPKYVARAIAEEIPPEMATTIAQYGIDMLPEAGMNKNPSLLGLYQQLEETVRQTVLQAGVQSGAIITGAKGAQKLSEVLKKLEPTGYQRDTSYEGIAEIIARSKGFLTPEGRGRETAAPTTQRVEPTLGEGPLPEPSGEPLTRVEPLMGEQAPAPVPAPSAQRIEELFQQGVDAGLPEEDARIRAENIVRAEEAKKEEALAPRISELTQEYIDAGITPAEAGQRAALQAKQEAAADETAASELERTRPITEPLPGAVGEGVGVAGQPAAGAPAPGVGVPKPAAVVSAGQAPAADMGREGAQPSAVEGKFNPFTFAMQSADSALADVGNFASEKDAVASYRENIVDTLREQGRDNPRTVEMALEIYDDAVKARATTPAQPTDGTQTPEAQQAEAQGQEAPAAGAPAAGKKRGRPAVLTPEEKAAKEAGRKDQRKVSMKADRAVVRLVKTLDELSAPINEGEFTSDQAFQDAVDANVAQRRDAIKELLTLQGDPTLRGTKTGQRVKEALSHPTITAKERASVQAGIDAQKKALEAAASVSRSTTGGAPADAQFSKFNNGAQALTHIIKTGNAFQKMLGKRLRAFVNGVQFVVIEQGQPLPAQLQTERNAKEWDRARALYIEDGITGKKIIYVRGESFGNDQGVNNVTVLHELLHAATNRKVALAMDALKRGVSLNDPLVKSAQVLLRTMNSAASTFNELARTGKLPQGVRPIAVESGGAALTDPREFIAYGMTDENFQNFLMQARGFEEDTSFFTRFVTGVRKLFGMSEDTTNALSDLILVTDTILSSRAPKVGVFKDSISPSAKIDDETAKEQKKINREFKIANEKFDQSKNGEEYANSVSAIQMLQDPRKVGRWLEINWGQFSGGAKNALAKAGPTDFLADAFSKAIPELQNTSNLIQKMNGMSFNLLKAAGKLADEINRAYRADPTLQAKLDRITNVSTLLEIDPSDSSAKKRSPDLDRMWKDLGDDGQRLYKRIKNHFEVLSDLFTQLLDAQLTTTGLTIAERANIVQQMRAMYEAEAKITPFFPLVRVGDYWLGIGSGQTRKFFLFKTAAERDSAMQGFANERIKRKAGESDAAFAKRQKDNLGELLETEEYIHGNDVSELRGFLNDPKEMIKGVFEAIDSAKLGEPGAKEALKDAAYQIFLQTMPEQSFRRQFIHREGVTGFRTDVLQNMAEATSRMATQLARLKYGNQLRNSLEQARESIRNRPAYEPVIAVFEDRVNEELNPKPATPAEKIAAGLNKAAYIWYLGAASSALLQPMSIFQTGVPVIAAQHGWTRTGAKMVKFMRVWKTLGSYVRNSDGTTSWVMPTMEHAKDIPAETRRALRALDDNGLSATSYADSIFDYKNTPSGRYSHPVTQLGKDTVNALVLGGLMHTTERISQQFVFAMSFELNRAKGLSFDESVNQAIADTKESLGNYSKYNRPAFMRGAIGKVITQFMMYPVHATLFLARNFAEMIKPMGGRTRTEAMNKFFGTLGTTSILAGAIGLPMFSIGMGLLGWFWKKLAEDDEDKELRNMDFELWFRTRWLPKMVGETQIAGTPLSDIIERGAVNAITGLDIGSRTSLNNLWMRDTKESATMRESAMALALEKAGPAANMALAWAEMYEAAMQGDYAKAIKKGPAGIAKPFTAYEQWKEGAKDNKGAQILSKDALTTGELLGQAIGFRSDALANLQYATFKVIGLQQRINNERNQILDGLDRGLRKEDTELYNKYYDKLIKFNGEHPSFAVKPENLFSSLTDRQKQRALSYRGVVVTKENEALAQALIPSRKAALAKEKKGRGE